MLTVAQQSESSPGRAGDWVKAPEYDRIRRVIELRRVLVVEDDKAIRELNRRILERSGFRVSLAADGLSGWEALRSRNFDLLITDHDMPRMTGAELVERLCRARMDIPVILASGNPNLQQSHPNSFLRLAAVLLKPFSPRRLIETVKRVLRGQAGTVAHVRASVVPGSGHRFRVGPACAYLGMMDGDESLGQGGGPGRRKRTLGLLEG